MAGVVYHAIISLQSMIKTFLSGAVVCAISLSSLAATAQKRANDFPRASPNASISQTVGVTDIIVTYARPSAKGRKVFGELEKFGKPWRIGANEATTITFPHQVKIEGKAVSAGTYALLAIPRSEQDWTVIINAVANMWGAYTYDSSKDVVRVPVKAQSTEHHELLTFDFTDVTPTSATLNFSWAKTRVPIHIDINTENIVRSLMQINVVEAEDAKHLFQAARWAYSSDFLLQDAVNWSTKAAKTVPSYDRLAIAARLHAKVGNYAEAVSYAERALAADQSKKSEPSIWPTLESLVPEWKKKL
jgi:hypothetical protein